MLKPFLHLYLKFYSDSWKIINDDGNDDAPMMKMTRQGQINKVMRNGRKLLRTLKISHAKQILFHEHESQFQITNDKD